MSKLRSKIMSIVVAAGLMAAAAAPVSAALTPSSIVDVVSSANYLTGDGLSITSASGDFGDNSYFKLTTTTNNYGRFSLKKPQSEGGGYIQPNDATKPMVWSMDVYPSSTNLTNIQLQTNSSVGMADTITPDMLNASEWNNLTLVYYPSEDTTKMGSADLYINGKYVSSKDLSDKPTTSLGKEYRFRVSGTAAGDILHMDNIKLAEAEGFTAPSLTSTSLTVGDGTISGYAGGDTVATVKGQLTASANADIKILNVDGTEASDETKVTAGMKAVAAIEVTGVNTYTKTYTFTNYEVISQATTNKNAVADMYGASSNAWVAASSDSGKKASLKIVSNNASEVRFAMKDSTGVPVAFNSGSGKTLVYSFEIYSNDFQTVSLSTVGGAFRAPRVSSESFNAGQWNKMMFVFNPKGSVAQGWRIDSYVNGKLVYANYYNGAVDGDFDGNPVRLNINPGASGKTIYLTNINIAKLSEFNRPEIKLTSCVTNMGTNGGGIDGYKNMTVADIKATATMADDVSIDKFYNANGEEIADDSTPLAPGMYVTVKTDYSDTNKYAFYANNYTYRYNIGAAYYSFGAVAFKSGEKVLKAPVDGTITASMNVNAYTDNVTGFAILAEYDTDGKLLRVAQNGYTYNKSENINNTVTRSLEKCSAANTYKFFVWNSLEGLKSLKNASELSPAQPE